MTVRKKTRDINENEHSTDIKQAQMSVTPMSQETARNTPSSSSLDKNLPIQPSERRNQPAERKDPSGPINKTHQNKTPAAGATAVWSEEDEKIWRRFRPCDRDPVSVFNGHPAPDIITKLKKNSKTIFAARSRSCRRRMP